MPRSIAWAALLLLSLMLGIAGAARATEAPVQPYTPKPYNPSTSDGPADNLNRFMLKITEQCYGMSDPAQRAECCRHLIDNLCSTDSKR